jgi:CPA1 family monovalent cation:H+ antiporter
VIAPTDPVAVGAVAIRHPIPARLLHLLQGEARRNDAAGLVCTRFAVAAALTGTFRLTGARVSFT